MKNLFLGLLFLSSLASCTHLEPETPVSTRSVSVEIPVISDQMQPQTRNTDETGIKDINYYLVSAASKEIIHGYQRSASLRFECPPGDYDLYVLANVHSDLGAKTAAELSALKIAYTFQYDDLPMWVKKSVEIPVQPKNTVYRLPAIEVKRGLAKVVVKLQSDDSEIRPKSIRIVCIPRNCKPFDERPSGSRADYTEGPITYFTEYNDSYSEVFYLPENLQGERPEITDEEQKGPDNAPQYATYMLIRAEKEDLVLAYRIYLGTNNTTNFDLRRNTCYSYNVTIKGENEVDTRVTSYYVSVMTDFSNKGCGTYYIPGSSTTLKVRIIGENTARVRGRLELLDGSPEYFFFDGRSGATQYSFTINDIDGLNTYPLNYNPPIITRDNSFLQIRVMVEDEGGIETGFTPQYRFQNIVEIQRSANVGKVSVSGATYTSTASDGTLTALCYENCTLNAVPDAGAIFEGWYADNNFQKLLSTNASYTYVPTACKGAIYAKFSQGKALDQTGTANCYIAPERETYYSFDATVRGNNKATTNITVQRLNGAQAKVIWETGSYAGDIVSNVSYGGGRILFRTGAFEGNALIGLFDKDGKCIWSWHIWATNYDPELTKQSYRGGSVFMDRNVGALSVNHRHYTTRGLYYQWGRKDPFLYPAGILSRVPLTGVYQNGFKNDRYSGATYVAYTIEHPTTYIDAGSDWQLLLSANINLWGNTSRNISNLSDVGIKSIYDPCPPGWRVPDRRTWEKAALKIKSVDVNHYFLCDAGSAAETCYPMSGFYYGSDYPNCGSWGYTWTNAPTADGATALVLQNGSVRPTENTKRYYAAPVRCMKE